MFEYRGIRITWLGHDSFSLEKGTRILTDPYQLSKGMEADIVLVSHNHFDHLSLVDMKKVSSNKTTIVAAKECISKLENISCRDAVGLVPGEEVIVLGVKIKAVAAYNLDKINPDTRRPFHPKEDSKVGFLITMGGVTIYHTGDSDLIPEMDDLHPDVLLIPVSGTYVMTSREAAQAVGRIKPKLAIPMHFGSIVGKVQDAEDFKRAVKGCEVQILQKEA